MAGEYNTILSDELYVSTVLIRGSDYLRNGRYSKGLAFKIEERQAFGFHGMLPPKVYSQKLQLELCLMNFERYTKDLDKYEYLITLLQSNETLFYKFAFDNIETVLPILYTPTVGLVCQMYTSMYKYPAGLYITVKDRGNIYKVLQNWPESDVKAIVVTDGERILGLGDLGAQGMGIPVGKLMLYTILGRLNPQYCLPITLDVGTNNQKLLDDPYYIGIREKRIVGEEYNEFIEEFLSAVIRSFSRKTLIQFEDFSTVNAFQILEKYKHDYCVFNDDIQGTASVVLSGLITANKVTTGGHQLSNNTFLFIGSGSVSIFM
uniref:Malic enzyme N-terminal domain-containing protein n=1 Tax=Clastoptera arizonana TaxID=38151 RepID=A0A1B6DRR9_9HEMI